jgi:hypothetical protein
MPRAAPCLLLAALLAPAAARAEELEVSPEAGNNALSAVFDARLGERITAVSSAVGCDLRLDRGAGTVSGRCSVPLASIRVDNDDTKSDHFRQWATNKRSDPATCLLEADLEGVKVGVLQPGKPVAFHAELPFRICGRGRAGGARERVSGTALLFPPGEYGARETIRIRATVAGLDREAYQVGPQFTEGWLARVQALAKVVAAKGDVELSLFARPRGS